MFHGRSRRFWSLFGTYGVLALTIAFLLGLIATGQIERFQFQQAERDLRVKAFLVGKSIPEFSPNQISHLQADANALDSEINSRITFLDSNGKVLADSVQDPAVMENHATRPEIIAARRGDGHLFIRRSNTTGATTLYVARRLRREASPVAFVRVASSVERIQASLVGLKRSIWTGAAGTAFGVIFLGFFLARGIAGRVREPVTATERSAGCRSPEFMISLTREIRSPLSVVKACAETLLNGAMDDAANRNFFLQQIDVKSDHIHRLLVDAVTLVRIESGARQFHFEAVFLEPAVTACLEGHQARANARNLVLELPSPAQSELKPSSSGSDCTGQTSAVAAWADEEALIQILDRLADRAISCTPSGGRIKIRWHINDKHVLLEVQDTGKGIMESDLSRIFDPFSRVDRARTREEDDVGLSLAIVKELADAMEGTIQTESVTGEGTTFRIRLRQAILAQ